MMKKCSTCGNTQEEGNFCGKCGAKVENYTAEVVNNEVAGEAKQEQKQPEIAATQETPTPPISEQQPNEQLEKVKEESKKYLNYFAQQLKSPSAQIDRDQLGFKNGLISIGLYILITAIAMYSLLRGVMGGYYYGPSLLQAFIYASIFFILVIGVNILAIFVTAKLFSGNRSFTEIVGNVGSYFVVPVALSTVGLLLAVLQSIGAATIILYIGGIIAFGIIPLFVMIKLLSTKSKTLDSFYAFLFYIVFTFILGLIVSLLIADSVIGDLLRSF